MGQQLISQYGEQSREQTGPVLPRDNYIGNATGIEFLPGGRFTGRGRAGAPRRRVGAGGASLSSAFLSIASPERCVA